MNICKRLSCLVIVLFITSGTSYAQSSAYCVYYANQDIVMEGNNIDVKLEMASTTKIMTALVVLENIPIDFTVKIKEEWTKVEGSSMNLKANEIYTVRDLLHGLMLASGNDASIALACATIGSVDGFVKAMNDKASELGLKNTRFANPHGLHQNGHYTSAYDLAVICDKAMQNDSFRSIVSCKEYEIEDLASGKSRTIYNKNKYLNYSEYADGIKIGYTTKAGRCLCASATKNGKRIICVIINRNDWFDFASKLIKKYF